MSKVEKVYKRDESKVRICPAWVIYTMPVVFVALILSAVMSCVFFGRTAGYVWSGVFGLSVFWAIFSDKYFSMYENCRIEFKKDKIVYRYELNRSVMPSHDVTTTVTISKLSKMSVRGKKVILKGEMTRKSPLKKEVSITKVELPIDFQDRKEIIEKFKERIS